MLNLLSGTLVLQFLSRYFKVLLNFFPRRSLSYAKFSSLTPWLPTSSVLDTKVIPLFFFYDLLLMDISKVCMEPMSSWTFMLHGSWASSIVVTFISNLLDNDLRIFMASFYSYIFSPKTKNFLAMSYNLMWNLLTVSFSFIFGFLNFVVRSFNLDIQTLDVTSWAVFRISHASLVYEHVLIILNMFLST